MVNLLYQYHIKSRVQKLQRHLIRNSKEIFLGVVLINFYQLPLSHFLIMTKLAKLQYVETWKN